MKTTYIILLITAILPASAQINQKFEQKTDGSYTKTYHQNGKLSTDIFMPSGYAKVGYAKAYNSIGELIYQKETSRSAMISGVNFSFYPNGAVKKADYSSHPDAGIQWYKEYTSFDESGNITGVINDDWDRTGLLKLGPGQTVKSPTPKTKTETHWTSNPNLSPKVNKDSLDFFAEFITKDPTGSLVNEKITFPEYGYTFTTWKVVDRIIRDKVEYYNSPGIQAIHKTYFDNGKLESEAIYEKDVYHYKRWNTDGVLVEVFYNKRI